MLDEVEGIDSWVSVRVADTGVDKKATAGAAGVRKSVGWFLLAKILLELYRLVIKLLKEGAKSI